MTSPLKKSLFYGQLATLYDSGLGFVEIFSSLEKNAPNGVLRNISRDLKRAVIAGHDIEETLLKHQSFFSAFELGMLKIGLESGELDQQASALELWFKKIQRFHWEVQKQLAFPLVLLILAYTIVNLQIFFIDGFEAFFREALLPVFLVLSGVGLFYFLFVAIKGQSSLEQMLGLLIPFIRKPIKQIMQARFLIAFSNLLDSGQTFAESITIAAQSTSSSYFTRVGKKIIHMLDDGASFTEAMQQFNVFDAHVIQLLSTGEKTGNLTGMALKASEMLEDDAEHRLQQVFRIFSLLFYLAVVAYIVYEVFLYWSDHLESILDAD